MPGSWRIFFILSAVVFAVAGVYQFFQRDTPSALMLLFCAGMLVFLFVRDRKKGGEP